MQNNVILFWKDLCSFHSVEFSWQTLVHFPPLWLRAPLRLFSPEFNHPINHHCEYVHPPCFSLFLNRLAFYSQQLSFQVIPVPRLDVFSLVSSCVTSCLFFVFFTSLIPGMFGTLTDLLWMTPWLTIKLSFGRKVCLFFLFFLHISSVQFCVAF